MTALPPTRPPTRFYHGDPVRLLVGFLAWRLPPEQFEASAGSLLGGPSNRFLVTNEPLTFVRSHPDKPGCAIARDATGRPWLCPTDYLAHDGDQT